MTSRHLCFAASVQAENILGSDPQGCAQAIGCGITASNDCYSLADFRSDAQFAWQEIHLNIGTHKKICRFVNPG